MAVQALTAEKLKQQKARLIAGVNWNNKDNLVFTDETGNHLAFSTFYKTFKRIATTIGRPDARPHDLRHTFATTALAAGADLKSVQDTLGHATASFTLQVYSHASDEMKKNLAARTDDFYARIL